MPLLRRTLRSTLPGLFLVVLAAHPGWSQTPPAPTGAKAKPAATTSPPATVHPRPPPHHPTAKPATAGTGKPEVARPIRKVPEKPTAPTRSAGKVPPKPKPLATAIKRPTKPAIAPAPAGKAPINPVAPPAAPAAPAPPEEPPKGTATGLPLPRFAALRSDEVNLRTGPGTRYPIDWVYKRRDLPVEIEREFEVWRLVVDPDGVKGWVHQATLTGRRSFVVMSGEHRLREQPQDASAPVALVKPGVIGHLLHCDAGSDWCRVQVDDYRGWLQRQEFWGSFKGEAIN